MPEFSMWGPEESGNRVFEQDAQNAMLKAAQSRNLNAGARKDELENIASEKMAAAMAGLGKGAQTVGDGSQASMVEQLARLAYESGSATKGADLATKAALIRSREATAKAGQATASRQQAELQLKTLEKATSLYEGVNDQTSLDKANALYAYSFGQPAPTAGLPYSPDLMSRIQQFGTTAVQRARMKIDADDAASKKANRNSAIEFRDFRRNTVLPAELELKRDREARLAKNGGGKAVPGPTTLEQKTAESLLAQEFPDLAQHNAAELKLAANTIASRAQALRKANRALDANTALRQALAEEKAAGSFQTVNDAYKTAGVINREGTRFKYKGEGRTPAQPLALPADRKVEVGKFYTTPKGVLKYLGPNKWEAVEAPTSGGNSLDAVDSDADEEDEE